MQNINTWHEANTKLGLMKLCKISICFLSVRGPYFHGLLSATVCGFDWFVCGVTECKFNRPIGYRPGFSMPIQSAWTGLSWIGFWTGLSIGLRPVPAVAMFPSYSWQIDSYNSLQQEVNCKFRSYFRKKCKFRSYFRKKCKISNLFSKKM